MNSGDSFLQSGKDDSLPISSPETRQNLQRLSPYLNFDPGYLPPSKPEFIFLDNTASKRGRFELAFSQIGASCILGAAFGGGGGLYNGLKSTSKLGQTGALRRTQLINYVVKHGTARANTLGTFAVMYSAFGVLLSALRGHDDELNTVIAGTATGLLYKSTAGLKKCGLGGAVGFGLSTLYCLATSSHKLGSMFSNV